MTTWGLIIMVASIIVYFVTNKKPVFLLTTGIGMGLLWGGLWMLSILGRAFG
jgi:hypothetical protein